jgi:hypothetical protein
MNTKTLLGIGAIGGAVYLATSKKAQAKVKKTTGLSNKGKSSRGLSSRTKLSQKKFIDSTENPALTRAILKQGDVDWAELIDRPEDFYDAGGGSVTGIIYYEDTVKFGKKWHNAILDELDNFEEETGGPLKKPRRSDTTQYYNWLTWFAWENMMSKLMGELGV